jgi:hypothetical protein
LRCNETSGTNSNDLRRRRRFRRDRGNRTTHRRGCGCWLGGRWASCSTRGLAVALDVDIETVVGVTAVFCAEAGTFLSTLADVDLLARNQVRAPAVLVLDDGEGVGADRLAAVVCAVAIGLEIPIVWEVLAERDDGVMQHSQTALLAVFCGEQYESVKASTEGADSRNTKNMATRPENVGPDLLIMVAEVWWRCRWW